MPYILSQHIKSGRKCNKNDYVTEKKEEDKHWENRTERENTQMKESESLTVSGPREIYDPENFNFWSLSTKILWQTNMDSNRSILHNFSRSVVRCIRAVRQFSFCKQNY